MKPQSEGVKDIESPSGVDLNPEPPSPVRLSKRAGVVVLVVIGAVVALVTFGIIKRSNGSFQMDAGPDESKGLTAATDAGKVITAQIPNRGFVGPAAARPADRSDELRPPGQSVGRSATDGNGQRMNAPATAPPTANPPQNREPSAEEKRLAIAYEREMQAMEAPTTSQGSASGFARLASPTSPGMESSASQFGSLLRSLQVGSGTSASAAPGPSPDGQSSSAPENRNEAFLARARAGSTDHYLDGTRTKPVGPYEIKAGWDIPAVLEQALNSDLPGEIKALVRENVYDTATGKYLLIPQGARLIGTYDSRVAYGQNGIQVVWNRLIFPDGSSINLDGMIAQDAAGYAGLRQDVDNHYKRLLGFGLLTSVFSASFQLSQTRRGSVLGYPSPAETAGSAVGAQISQLGADVTRRNLDIQPTIKVPIGYRFNVRVNRDMLFESPYRPTAE